MRKPVFSVVTPTYNRAELIHRVFDSLLEQTFKNFEWIVVDDGSTDETELVIREYSELAPFPIKYIKTENHGKAKALNVSVPYCEGVLYLVIDSDDWCDKDALEVFFREYNEIVEAGVAAEYCGLSALKRDVSGSVVGDDYSVLDKHGCSYIDRMNRGVKGDKWECMVTEKIKMLYYPVLPGEKYMAPGYLWLKLAASGDKTVFINRSLSTVEYQPDGISKNNLKHRLASIYTTINFYRDFYDVRSFNYLTRARFYANYVRFSVHAGQLGKLSPRYLPFYLVGLSLYAQDCLRQR